MNNEETKEQSVVFILKVFFCYFVTLLFSFSGNEVAYKHTAR